jgi:hypothetical protein
MSLPASDSPPNKRNHQTKSFRGKTRRGTCTSRGTRPPGGTTRSREILTLRRRNRLEKGTLGIRRRSGCLGRLCTPWARV